MRRLALLVSILFCLAPLQAEQFQGSISHAGQEIPITVFTPEGYRSGQTPPLMITLPPGPGDADMVKANLANYWLSEGLRRGYVVVAPQVFGRSLEQDPAKFVDSLFSWLGSELAFDRRRVVLTGQSNGGIGAFYLATARPERFKAVLVIPGQYLGAPKNLARLRGKPIWMLMGAQDDPQRWAEPVRATYNELKKYHARVQLDVLPGQGHVPRVDPRSLYDWLDKQ